MVWRTRIAALRWAPVVVLVAGALNGCQAGPAAQVSMPCNGPDCPVVPVLSFEAIPPGSNSQGWVPQEFTGVKVDQDQLRLALRPSLTIQGRVYPSHDSAVSIPSQITAWRRSALPGRPDVRSEVTTPLEGGDKGSFVLWLERGQTYDFYVRPLPRFDGLFPPQYTTLTVTEHLLHDFVLDGDDRAVELVGHVRQSDGTPFPYSLQVRAYRPGTWVRSTVGRTCSAASPSNCPGNAYSETTAGQFSLRIPPGVHPYNLVIEPLPEQSAARDLLPYQGIELIPRVTCYSRLLGLVHSTPNPYEVAVQSLGDPLRLPKVSQATSHAVDVVDDEGAPIAGAEVTLETTLEQPTNAGFQRCEVSHSAVAIADGKGRVVLPFLHAPSIFGYRLTIKPQGDSPHASRAYTLVPGDISEGQPIRAQLKRRRLIGGLLQSSRGGPLSAARVVARPIESLDGAPLVSTSTTSDAAGRFELPVDSGKFAIDVTPAAGSQASAFSAGTITMPGDSNETAVPAELNVTAPPVSSLAGKLVDSDGRPVSGYMLFQYESVQGQAVLRASTVTNASGRFELLVSLEP
ncbi:MAG: hypothetical protein H6707_19640 [Deltaproteobacteria bacterium]|nr:hypothetical protein [Deltaproteobacteria bacterium]